MPDPIDPPVDPPVDPATPAQKVEPKDPPVDPSPIEFNADFDREALLKNAPDGTDVDKLGKWLDKTKNPYDSFKSNVNLEGMKSKGLPNEAWTDDDYAVLNDALGVPKEESDYKYSDETTLSEESEARVRAISLEGKHTPAQAQQLANVVQELESKGLEMQQQAEQDASDNMVNFLESEWGHPDTESYRSNHEMVKEYLAVNGVEHDSDVSNAIWMGPPSVIKMLHTAAKMMEPSDSPRVRDGSLETPNSIESQLESIASDMNSHAPGTKEREQLEIAYDKKYAHLQRIKK